ncbi:ABC transporter permease subunit [Saccharolobus islandicus]|uniref:Peptide ABC transporter, permease protein n=1 Tax=Saccharolobus islandicus (strain HVE10/4) TaxID=930943 RepID=F0NP69_SACI0|nr:ABC transporter permease [Sulfolobus islandicus]ADX82255.1 peptide ABC transporter, permease protein [Sulfolobus islandicus HVE10/4]WCM36432.1 ABC transporter permease subunit [Sulfolobus islandicus]
MDFSKLLKIITKLLIMIMLISILSYILARISTSVYTMLSYYEYSSPRVVEALSKYYGFGVSPLQGALIYLGDLFSGNMGISIFYDMPVSNIVFDALMKSLLIILPSTVLSTFLVFILVIYTIKYMGTRLDRVVDYLFISLMAIPEVLLAIIFFLYLPSSILSMIALLALYQATFIYVFMRRNMVHILSESLDLVEYYLSLGFKGKEIARELIRMSLPLFYTSIAYSISTVIPVLVFVETVFNYSGIGYMMFTALENSDYPLASGCFLILAIIAILSNMIADLISSRYDWRQDI